MAEKKSKSSIGIVIIVLLVVAIGVGCFYSYSRSKKTETEETVTTAENTGVTTPNQPRFSMADVPGKYHVEVPAADTPGRIVTLQLEDGGQGTLSSDYMNGEAPIVENGAWTTDLDSNTVTFTGDNQTKIVFAFNGNELQALEYDKSVWGEYGITLFRALETMSTTDSTSLPAQEENAEVGTEADPISTLDPTESNVQPQE